VARSGNGVFVARRNATKAAKMDVPIMASFSELNMSILRKEGAKWLRRRYIANYNADLEIRGASEERRTMTTNSHSGSATIYAFPARGRFAPNGRHDEAAKLASPRPTKVVIGEAWYHEEAIQEAIKEADRNRKN
jgi:hypothetical protein